MVSLKKEIGREKKRGGREMSASQVGLREQKLERKKKVGLDKQRKQAQNNFLAQNL